MKKIFYMAAAGAILSSVILTGCKKNDVPDHFSPANLTANTTIKQLKTYYKSGGAIINDPDMVISGVVISSDRAGNFYRSFYIQDGTSGIEIKDGTRNGLYHVYHIGQRVYVKPYHLTLGAYGGMISLGYQSADAKYENEWLDAPLLIQNSIFRGDMTRPVTPTAVTAGSQITDDMMGTLITITNAIYKGGNMTTWARKPNTSIDPNDVGTYGEQNFQLSDNVVVVVRTSPFANFAYKTVPFSIGDKVNVTAVLVKFNTTNQLTMNTDADAVKVP